MEWLKGMFDSPTLSDLKIKTSSREFKVHKAIVCSQCEKFFKACTGTYRESVDGVIDLSKDDGVVDELADDLAIESMLRFFYEQDYTVDEDPDAERHPLVHHASVFVQGVYHNIPRLSRLATSKFEAACADPATWSKEAFFESVRLVYENTLADEGVTLRQVMAEVSVTCFDEIFETDIDVARTLMQDVPEFTADIAYLFSAENGALLYDYHHQKLRADARQNRIRELEAQHSGLVRAREDTKVFQCESGHYWSVFIGAMPDHPNVSICPFQDCLETIPWDNAL